MTIEEILKKHNLDHVDVYEPMNATNVYEYRAAVMLASQSPDSKVDAVHIDGGIPNPGWTENISPMWEWASVIYRINPAGRPKKTRPWSKLGDVPPTAAWLRKPKNNRARNWLIVAFEEEGLYTFDASACLSWKYIAEGNYEWSTDRESWHPCTTELP